MVNLLSSSSRSLRSMGSLRRTFTKSTRNASGGKCPAQLSLLTPPPCPFPSKTLAQGAPSRFALPGRGLLLGAELCLYLALWRGRGDVELGWRAPYQAKATCRDQTLIAVGKERSGRQMQGSSYTTYSGGEGSTGPHVRNNQGNQVI